MKLTIKWRCDVAMQHTYKQKFIKKDSSDDNMFSISVVPLQLNSILESEICEQIIWQNSTSSVKYCHLIKFVYTKENRKVIISEVKQIESQIQDLVPTKVISGSQI